MTSVRFIRNFVLEPIEYWLRRELEPEGLAISCAFGDYAGAPPEIEALAEAAPSGDGITVLALGLEMTSPDFGHARWPAEAACARHLALVRRALEVSRGAMVVNTVLPPPHDALGGALDPAQRSADECIDELNAGLRRLAAAHAGRVLLCDWGRIARTLGHAHTYDQRYWRTSAAPFASRFLAAYAAAIAPLVRLRAGRVRKVLVLDCDNTLWGGIVGEDGLDGIQLSEDTLPGAYFREFQRSVLDLHARGVLLALASKNNEADVFDVLDRHPACLLKREHLAAWRVDWNDKATSIAALAAELDLGLDAFVFIDDSAMECELVSKAWPTVRVLATPKAPADLVGFLERSHAFASLVVTPDDAGRTRSYQDNRERRIALSQPGDAAALKRELQTRVTVREARDADAARVAQLVMRTNQFNLTTRRHALETLQGFMRSDRHLVACAELEDRFGALGTIGVAIVESDGTLATVDTLLMSCRALGRDAELAFAAGLYRLVAARWPQACLRAAYIASAKNAQAESFWPRAGLEPAGDNVFQSPLDLRSLAQACLPGHVTLEVENA